MKNLKKNYWKHSALISTSGWKGQVQIWYFTVAAVAHGVLYLLKGVWFLLLTGHLWWHRDRSSILYMLTFQLVLSGEGTKHSIPNGLKSFHYIALHSGIFRTGCRILHILPVSGAFYGCHVKTTFTWITSVMFQNKT